MIKLVAFDWNGTLIADAQTVVDCSNIQQKRGFGSNKIITIKTYRDTFDIPVNKFFISLGLNPKLVKQKFKEAADVFHQEYEKRVKRCRTRKGVKTILKWLQGNSIQSVIVSNHAKERIKKQLRRLKIDKLINSTLANEHIYIAYTIKGKEKRLINYIAKNKIKPQEILVIGDAIEDIKIGKDMDAKTVALTNGHCSNIRLKATKPDYLINNLKELIPIVTKLNQNN